MLLMLLQLLLAFLLTIFSNRSSVSESTWLFYLPPQSSHSIGLLDEILYYDQESPFVRYNFIFSFSACVRKFPSENKFTCTPVLLSTHNGLYAEGYTGNYALPPLIYHKA